MTPAGEMRRAMKAALTISMLILAAGSAFASEEDLTTRLAAAQMPPGTDGEEPRPGRLALVASGEDLAARGTATRRTGKVLTIGGIALTGVAATLAFVDLFDQLA